MFTLMAIRYKNAEKLPEGGGLIEHVFQNGAIYFFAILLAVLFSVFMNPLGPPALNVTNPGYVPV